MKKIVLVMVLIASMCFADYSETNTWLVSKNGNDGNPGAPTSDPVNLATDSFLTVAAAISAASSGDKILIWPGTYAEAISPGKRLEVIGVGPKGSIVIGSGITTGASDSNSIYRNIKAVGTNIGWSVNSSSGLYIEDCYAYGPTDGFYGATSKSAFIRCYSSSNWDGANLMSGTDNLFRDCTFEASSTVANAGHALQSASSGKYLNCDFIINDTQTTVNQLCAVKIAGAYNYIFDNCRFITKGNSGRTGNVMGLFVNNASANVLIDRCIFDTNAVSAGNSAPDINNVAGNVVVNGCLYEKALGAIKVPKTDAGGSGRYGGW